MEQRTPEIVRLSIEQIPFDLLEQNLGIPRSAFLCTDNSDDILEALTVLVEGRSRLTPPIKVDIYNAGLGYQKACFSVYSKNGKIEMLIHPISKQITQFDNVFGLDNHEIQLLESGEIISKVLPTTDGRKEDCFIQMYPGANFLMVLPKWTLIVPEEIGQVKQTKENIEKFKSGKEIDIIQKDGTAFKVKVDLTSPIMLNAVQNFDKLVRGQDKNIEQGVSKAIGEEADRKTGMKR